MRGWTGWHAPFQTAELLQASFTQWQRLASAAMGGSPAIAPQPDDRRFADQAWRQRPCDVLSQAVLLRKQCWGKLVQGPGGVNPQNRRIVTFTVRQLLDPASAPNVAWLNPQVIEATRASGGANLAAGMRNLMWDQAAAHGTAAPSAFRAGKDLAATPGKVVFRNALMELILGLLRPRPWSVRHGHQPASSTLGEACPTRDRPLRRVVDATTVAGVLAKAGTVGMLLNDKRGLKAEAVRLLLADLAAGVQPGAGVGGRAWTLTAERPFEIALARLGVAGLAPQRPALARGHEHCRNRGSGGNHHLHTDRSGTANPGRHHS